METASKGSGEFHAAPDSLPIGATTPGASEMRCKPSARAVKNSSPKPGLWSSYQAAAKAASNSAAGRTAKFTHVTLRPR